MGYLRIALLGAWAAGLWLVLPTGPSWAQVATEARPALREFVATVIEAHPALSKARADIAAARARARGQAMPLYKPELELGYENALDDTAAAGLSQTFDVVGKRGSRADVATAEVVAAEARYRIARKTVIANTLTALSEYRTLGARVAIAETRVRLAREFLSLAERRNRAGDLPLAELLTARLNLSEAKAAESAAQIDRAMAEQGLLEEIGNVSLVLPELREEWPDAPAPLENVSLETLPELVLGRAQTRIARSRIDVAQKNRVLDPTFGFVVGDQSAPADSGGRESATLFGLSLRIPLPVRNDFSAEVDAAGADWVASEQDYYDLRRRVDARLTTSHRRLLTALEAWKGWTAESAATLEEQRAVLQKLWDVGEINAVDYIIQLNQTFATESAGVDLRGRLWAAWFDWLDASGSIGEWVEGRK